jgi:hypothetical protein
LVFAADLSLRAGFSARVSAKAQRRFRHLPGRIQFCRFEDGQRPVNVAGQARWPWQDRWMLFGFATPLRTIASRRLAHGFRAAVKTMRDNRNVQYSSCST